MTLAVRRAEPADAAEICAVLRASITELLTLEHRHDPATLGAWLENKTVENALRWIAADDRYAIVATGAGTVCGFGMLKSTGEIGLLYVAPSARFRGVSKALLAALEERAAAWRLRRVTANSSYTALPFYRARGYEHDGEPVQGFGVTRMWPVVKTLPAGQRIVVVGTSCCGKTAFARLLAQSLRYPCVELDELYWGPQWTPKPDAEFRRSVQTAAGAPRWVADGNYGRVRDILWPRATTIVWLNYSFQCVLLRALRRTLGRLITREPLWYGNKESIRRSLFCKYPHLSWVELRRPSEAEPYLRSIQPEHAPD